MSYPDNYNTFTLPTLKFSHHPASSASVTPVIIVYLNRPSARHAWTDEMAENLITAFDSLSADPRVRAIILTSADTTNRFYCAGMDFNATHRQNENSKLAHRDSGGQASLAMTRCTKPIICAINGSAVGVGMTMTLPATIRVVNKDAKVGFVFGRRGFCMEACSSFYLPRLIGVSRAMHLVSTGAVYPASHKLFDGLFSEVVPADEVLPTALKIADDIALNMSIPSYKVMKDLMIYGPKTPEEAHLLESKLFHDLVNGRDAKEGVESFMKKRAPELKGNMDDDKPAAWPWYTPLDVKARM